MQHLQVSCAVRPIYRSLGFKGLKIGQSASRIEGNGKMLIRPILPTSEGSSAPRRRRDCMQHNGVATLMVKTNEYWYY